MKKTFLTLAFGLSVAFATAAPALADEPQRVQFSYDGVNYSYTVTKLGKSTIYDGHASPGDDFHLVERNGRVAGRSGGMWISYDAPSAEMRSATARQVRLASR